MLVGCHDSVQIKEVKVPVYKYVAVPAKYTAHVDIAEPIDDTVSTMRNVTYKRKLGLQQCNKQLDSILFIQGTDTDGN
jgi:hypothetical protein